MIILKIDKRFEWATTLLMVMLFYPIIGLSLAFVNIDEAIYLSNIYGNVILGMVLVIFIIALKYLHIIKNARMLNKQQKLPTLIPLSKWMLLLGYLMIVMLYGFGAGIVTLGYLDMNYRLFLLVGIIVLIGMNFILNEKGLHGFQHVFFLPFKPNVSLFTSKESSAYFIKRK